MLDKQKIEELQSEVVGFVGEHQRLQIESAEDYAIAGEILKLVSDKIKAVDKKRKEYTVPLETAKKAIIADFKSLKAPLEEFVKETKEKMVVWHTEDQRKRDEEQQRIEAQAVQEAREQQLDEVVVPVVNKEVKTVKSAHATTTAKKVWKSEVVDESIVPREYLKIDTVKINAVVRAGTRSIPGVKIYQDIQISIK